MAPKKLHPKEDADLHSDPKQEKGTKEAERDAEKENNNAQEEPEPYKSRNKKPMQDKSAKTLRLTKTSVNRTRRHHKARALHLLLNFLLSAEALPYCFSQDELEAAKKSAKLKCYSLTSPTSFTPFEHLICAHLLSKPLSHVLGMRSIRTLLNEPHSFSTPEAIIEAGEKRVWEALEDARTQHRQTTASYIFATAESYADSEIMFALAEKANDEGSAGVMAYIKNTVPVLGNVGGEIFGRRIQYVDGWGDALWPYADGKALDSLRETGIKVTMRRTCRMRLSGRLVGIGSWDMGLHDSALSKGELVGEEMEMQVQAEFMVALERAVGCVLEGKAAEFQKAAAEA